MKPEYFGKFYALGANSKARVQRLGELFKYTVMTETIPNLDLYSNRSKDSDDVNMGDLLEVGMIRKVPMIQRMTENGRETGSFTKFVYLANSVKRKATVDLKTAVKRSDIQHVKPETGSGEITDGCDFKASFPKLMLLSATPVDEYINNERTGFIDHILVIVRSEKNDETYRIKVGNTESEVLNYPMFTELEMVEPKGRVFADVSQVETGLITVSLSADDMVKVAEEEKVKADASAPAKEKQADKK